MKRFASLGLVLLLILFAGTSALAQMTSGELVGAVRDATGAAIASAQVKAVNNDTKVETDTRTNGSGEYRIPNLPYGNYNVSASAPGFTTVSKTNFAVEVNHTATVQFDLAPAGSSQTILVSADAGLALDTTTTQLQQTFSAEEVSNLPTATVGLGVLNLSLLSPNVGTSGGIGAGTGPSVGGQRPRANNFTIEGIDNNDKSVTGPLLYVPNDAVGNFTLITNQFSPEFGHSAGGQFNTVVTSGTNTFHGRAYEYFENRNLNAIDAVTARSFQAGTKPFNPRYDNNRYGGQLGGPILKDKLFFFGNFERQSIGQSLTYALCTPIASGLAALKSVPGLNQTNLGIYEKYIPAAPGTVGVDASNDSVCGNQPTGPQSLTVYENGNLNPVTGEYGTGTPHNIPLGNFQVAAPNFSNFDVLTTGADWTLSQKDNLRLRYIYNTLGSEDTAAYLPAFFTTIPNKYHLIAFSEYHTFTPNLTNELRVGYHRYFNQTPSGNFSFPGVDSFPNLTYFDQGGINIGPDGNAPQATIENLYQFTNNVNWVKGNHTFKFGFDGRKAISPQSFTQRVRGDYYWNFLTEYLNDVAPTNFGERSTGNFFYYGDQTAFYGYANDTWRIRPNITLNYGLRYEFTAIPTGERVQALNAAASAPGVIDFAKPKPQYTNFAPRIGIDWAPDQKTSVRAGFGMAYDVLYDNLGILSFPPQFSSTNDVGNAGVPQPGDPNFLKNGGLLPGTGTLATFPTIAAQRAATSAYVPNQKLPYAETYSLGVQRLIGSNYTAEVRYLGTRGIHLSTQIQLNKQPKVDATHFLPTLLDGPTPGVLTGNGNTLASLKARSNYVPSFAAAGFTSNITSFQPFSQSNYNALSASLVRRFEHGLQLDAAYTWSKTMDDATADVFSTVLSPRRVQDFQNVAADYGRSALSRTHRLTIETIYELPFYKHSNWLLKNLVGNWTVAPIYTYQSPEYGTVQSGDDANLNGDAAPDRTVINPNGVKGTGSGVVPVKDSSGATVAYSAKNPNAYYIQAGPGALANGARNTLPLRPTNDVDATASKRINFTERYALEFQAQAFNVLNHPQFLSGSINTINSIGDTSGTTRSFLLPSNGLFNQPQKVFASNSRVMQLALKLSF